MGKRATFTQAEVTRAIRAAMAAGLPVNRCEIGPDGSIIVSAQAVTETPATVYDAWKATQQ